MPDFIIKFGATAPNIRGFLEDSEGTAIPNLDTVTFQMRSQLGGALVINKPATLVSAVTAEVQYEWDPDDDEPGVVGEYYAEWEAVDDNGKIWKVPTSEHITISIRPDLP